MILGTSSLSTLIFIANIQIHMINWKYICRGPCDACYKRGPHFEKIKSLEDVNEYWKNEKKSELGFFTCKICKSNSKSRYLHRRCFSKMKINKKQFNSTGYYTYCKVCLRVSHLILIV